VNGRKAGRHRRHLIMPRTLHLLFALVFVLLSTAPLETRADTLLAVGVMYGEAAPDGGLQATPMILRRASGSWEQVKLPNSAEGDLRGVVFTSPTTAWSYGATRLGTPTLLRSHDTGLTWEDRTHALPPDVLPYDGALAGLAATDDSTNWLVATGPTVFVTTDDGATWASTLNVDHATGGRYWLASRNGAIELIRMDGNGARSQTVGNSPNDAPTPIGQPDQFIADAAAVSGATLWVAGSSRAMAADLNDRPSIFVSRTPGSWTEQSIVGSTRAQLRTIDMRDTTHGVAGGFTLNERAVTPFLLYTSDGGSTWTPSDIPNELGDMVVAAAVRSDAGSGWAVVTPQDAPGFVMLTTADGGKVWSPTSVVGDTMGRVQAFARSPQSSL
jgi:photosystem II stability/assembly factor-like uncharacterized protein